MKRKIFRHVRRIILQWQKTKGGFFNPENEVFQDFLFSTLLCAYSLKKSLEFEGLKRCKVGCFRPPASQPTFRADLVSLTHDEILTTRHETIHPLAMFLAKTLTIVMCS